jgi:hypothetical protein
MPVRRSRDAALGTAIGPQRGQVREERTHENILVACGEFSGHRVGPVVCSCVLTSHEREWYDADDAARSLFGRPIRRCAGASCGSRLVLTGR